MGDTETFSSVGGFLCSASCDRASLFVHIPSCEVFHSVEVCWLVLTVKKRNL